MFGAEADTNRTFYNANVGKLNSSTSAKSLQELQLAEFCGL